ncbi:Abi family protein [Salinibacterium sp. SWN248]|uniref:Abi family protein n=1 Tax=Salinibacterium sp. SWN248 TaxID=2792056 RepID=UPI0018CC8850|nr:Abi family protein [Salinibacterium sp. SWN248]MBH0022939.1 Abi family protein [Salinibacterium sp. SWN248]
MVNSQQWSFYEQHFATARLQHYLDACGGDLVAAVRLYEWNAAVSAAFWESLSFLEVGLRNAIDLELTTIHESKGRAGHWIFDDAKELGRDRFGPRQHKQPYKDVAIAIERVRRNGMPVSPGQIISEISFGFWHQMVSKGQVFLWPDLAGAFPNSPNRGQKTVQEPVARLRDFRNRIGHHHRIWSSDLAARYDDLLTVAGYLDVDFASWIDDRSRVIEVLAQKPSFTKTAK